MRIHFPFSACFSELPKPKGLGLLASLANTYTIYLAILVQRYQPSQDSSLSVPKRRLFHIMPWLVSLGHFLHFANHDASHNSYSHNLAPVRAVSFFARILDKSAYSDNFAILHRSLSWSSTSL